MGEEGERGGREGRGGEGGGGRERGREGGCDAGRNGRGEEKREVKGESVKGFFSLHTCSYTVYSPIEIERGGRKREILHDHNDMYILHLCKILVSCDVT